MPYWMIRDKLIADVVGKPRDCDDCPCLEDWLKPCWPPEIVYNPPKILYMTGELHYGMFNDEPESLTCHEGVANTTPLPYIVPLSVQMVLQEDVGFGLSGWVGMFNVPHVNVISNEEVFSVSYPPYPETPYPDIVDDAGNHTGIPCQYLFRHLFPVIFRLECSGGALHIAVAQDGVSAWAHPLTLGAVDGGSFDPFTFVYTPSVHGGFNVPTTYPDGSEYELCGNRRCVLGPNMLSGLIFDNFRLISILE